MDDIQNLNIRRLQTFDRAEALYRAAQLVLPPTDYKSLDIGDVYKRLNYKPNNTTMSIKYETAAGTPAQIRAAIEHARFARRRPCPRSIAADDFDPQGYYRQAIDPQWSDQPSDDGADQLLPSFYRFDALGRLTFWIRVALLTLLIIIIIKTLTVKK
ncbi:MAG: hypothetical protein LBF90_03275 [Prevotellaceae bacterium]|jgi:hypothetical protein|nr:hypothetical protein [Prevotellaceae bacterium]